jgi:hypothetical protein
MTDFNKNYVGATLVVARRGGFKWKCSVRFYARRKNKQIKAFVFVV